MIRKGQTQAATMFRVHTTEVYPIAATRRLSINGLSKTPLNQLLSDTTIEALYLIFALTHDS